MKILRMFGMCWFLGMASLSNIAFAANPLLVTIWSPEAGTATGNAFAVTFSAACPNPNILASVSVVLVLADKTTIACGAAQNFAPNQFTSLCMGNIPAGSAFFIDIHVTCRKPDGTFYSDDFLQLNEG